MRVRVDFRRVPVACAGITGGVSSVELLGAIIGTASGVGLRGWGILGWGQCQRTGVICRWIVVVVVGTVEGRCRDMCVRWDVCTRGLQDGAVADPLGDSLDGGKVFFFRRDTLVV